MMAAARLCCLGSAVRWDGVFVSITILSTFQTASASSLGECSSSSLSLKLVMFGGTKS